MSKITGFLSMKPPTKVSTLPLTITEEEKARLAYTKMIRGANFSIKGKLSEESQLIKAKAAYADATKFSLESKGRKYCLSHFGEIYPKAFEVEEKEFVLFMRENLNTNYNLHYEEGRYLLDGRSREAMFFDFVDGCAVDCVVRFTEPKRYFIVTDKHYGSPRDYAPIEDDMLDNSCIGFNFKEMRVFGSEQIDYADPANADSIFKTIYDMGIDIYGFYHLALNGKYVGRRSRDDLENGVAYKYYRFGTEFFTTMSNEQFDLMDNIYSNLQVLDAYDNIALLKGRKIHKISVAEIVHMILHRITLKGTLYIDIVNTGMVTSQSKKVYLGWDNMNNPRTEEPVDKKDILFYYERVGDTVHVGLETNRDLPCTCKNEVLAIIKQNKIRAKPFLLISMIGSQKITNKQNLVSDLMDILKTMKNQKIDMIIDGVIKVQYLKGDPIPEIVKATKEKISLFLNNDFSIMFPVSISINNSETLEVLIDMEMTISQVIGLIDPQKGGRLFKSIQGGYSEKRELTSTVHKEGIVRGDTLWYIVNLTANGRVSSDNQRYYSDEFMAVEAGLTTMRININNDVECISVPFCPDLTASYKEFIMNMTGVSSERFDMWILKCKQGPILSTHDFLDAKDIQENYLAYLFPDVRLRKQGYNSAGRKGFCAYEQFTNWRPTISNLFKHTFYIDFRGGYLYRGDPFAIIPGRSVEEIILKNVRVLKEMLCPERRTNSDLIENIKRRMCSLRCSESDKSLILDHLTRTRKVEWHQVLHKSHWNWLTLRKDMMSTSILLSDEITVALRFFLLGSPTDLFKNCCTIAEHDSFGVIKLGWDAGAFSYSSVLFWFLLKFYCPPQEASNTLLFDVANFYALSETQLKEFHSSPERYTEDCDLWDGNNVEDHIQTMESELESYQMELLKTGSEVLPTSHACLSLVLEQAMRLRRRCFFNEDSFSLGDYDHIFGFHSYLPHRILRSGQKADLQPGPTSFPVYSFIPEFDPCNHIPETYLGGKIISRMRGDNIPGQWMNYVTDRPDFLYNHENWLKSLRGRQGFINHSYSALSRQNDLLTNDKALVVCLSDMFETVSTRYNKTPGNTIKREYKIGREFGMSNYYKNPITLNVFSRYDLEISRHSILHEKLDSEFSVAMYDETNHRRLSMFIKDENFLRKILWMPCTDFFSDDITELCISPLISVVQMAYMKDPAQIWAINCWINYLGLRDLYKDYCWSEHYDTEGRNKRFIVQGREFSNFSNCATNGGYPVEYNTRRNEVGVKCVHIEELETLTAELTKTCSYSQGLYMMILDYKRLGFIPTENPSYVSDGARTTLSSRDVKLHLRPVH